MNATSLEKRSSLINSGVIALIVPRWGNRIFSFFSRSERWSVGGVRRWNYYVSLQAKVCLIFKVSGFWLCHLGAILGEGSRYSDMFWIQHPNCKSLDSLDLT